MRERGLDGVSGDELEGWLTALVDADPEAKTAATRTNAPAPSHAEADARSFAAMGGQVGVDDEQQDDGRVESNPPCPRCASDHATMLAHGMDWGIGRTFRQLASLCDGRGGPTRQCRCR